MSDVLYDDSWQRGARTSCIFTSMVLSSYLGTLGFNARPTPIAVEGRIPGGRFGIGHPDHPLTRPQAWKGHLVCMVEDVLVDATISQIRAWGVDAPLLVAIRCARPWHPEAAARLPSGCTLTWSARGANHDWATKPDAAAAAWRPAVARLIERLHTARGTTQPPSDLRRQATPS